MQVEEAVIKQRDAAVSVVTVVKYWDYRAYDNGRVLGIRHFPANFGI